MTGIAGDIDFVSIFPARLLATDSLACGTVESQMKKILDRIILFFGSLLAIPSVMNRPMHDIEDREVTVDVRASDATSGLASF
jgi:hypothetical protein